MDKFHVLTLICMLFVIINCDNKDNYIVNSSETLSINKTIPVCDALSSLEDKLTDVKLKTKADLSLVRESDVIAIGASLFCNVTKS